MELKDLMSDFQTFHSDLQIDAFIMEKGGGTTDYGKYVQALREISSRITNLRERKLDIEKLNVEIEKEIYNSEFNENPFDRKLAAIEAKRKQGQLDDLIMVHDDTERELNRFIIHAMELKSRIGDLDPEKRAILDKEMWLEKIMEYASLDFIVQNKLTRETIEIIRCLPNDLKSIMLECIKEPDKLLNWFQSDKRTLPTIKNTPLLSDIKTLK